MEKLLGRALGLVGLVTSCLVASPARADNPLQIAAVKFDVPTVISLGVQVLITGDESFDAKIAVRYRVTGTQAWKDALPLWRVHPELVVARAIQPQFAGSIFELAPGTSYDIELHATDPDGNVDITQMVTASTRPVPPSDPKAPRAVAVSDVASLNAALSAAKPGDVITLANGTYAGTFSLSASGTVDNPIVLRGQSEDGVILDGGGCTGCNEIDVYASYVNIERLTIQHAERAIRWQTPGAQGNVLRRVHAKDVRLGIGGQQSQVGFYICDNVFEGRLAWPLTYGDDQAAHANDDGLVVQGSGHVVCHNRISGFADALQNFEEGTRANDFYGNETLWTYDDGIELDGTEGNSRCFRNRFSNTYDTLSYQPIYGGPAYTFRNVIVNVDNEGMKLHALGGTPSQVPVGVAIWNNTFVRAYHAIQLSTPDAVHDYALANNLFIGPAQPTMGLTVQWDTPIDFQTGRLDYDGFAPEGQFELGYGATGTTYPSFAALAAGGRYEAHGVLATGSLFASGLVAPSDHHPLVAPADATLASGSSAVDKGTTLANIDDGFTGVAPDLGALERGCPSPIYGPRPDGVDETNEPRGCETPVRGDAGVGGNDGGGDSGVSTVPVDGGNGGTGLDGGNRGQPAAGPSTSSGCGCRTARGELGRGWTMGIALASLLASVGRRRRRTESGLGR